MGNNGMYSETEALLDISSLSSFDRIAFRYGRLLQVTGGATLKSPAKGKVMTKEEVALNYLKKEEAYTFETGKSAVQAAKALGTGRVTTSQAFNNLLAKGIVKSEQRGRQVRYFLVEKQK